MTVTEHVASAECYDAGCRDMGCRLAKTDALKAEYARPVAGARTIGAVALLEPGHRVYAKESHFIDGAETFPKGGTIVEVTQTRGDRETGEAPQRAFRTLRYFRGKVRADLLTELDVDQQMMLMADEGEMRSLVRTAARELAEGRGAFLGRQADLAKWIHLLTGLVTGAGR